MSDYHEPEAELSPHDRDIHRALNSLKEEIEAVDWYHQRVVTSQNASLAQIMAHNRDEEIEHAIMNLEWLRRNMPVWDEELRTYLFTEGEITELEENDKEGEQQAPGSSLNIGGLE
jgi:ferritin-like protein